MWEYSRSFPHLHAVGQLVVPSAFKDIFPAYEQGVSLTSIRSSVLRDSRWHVIEHFSKYI